jgi:predicted Zn finger-like uncharacterized protein
MNVSCPECSIVYRIDPARVPDGGARTRCRDCHTALLIDAGQDQAVRGAVVTARRVVTAPTAPEATTEAADATTETAGASPQAAASLPVRGAVAEPAGNGVARAEAEASGPSAGPAVPVFGPQDPQTRARRLARALVSDIKAYNRDRWEQSLAAGTLRRDFRDEILKSWEEYVEQVGEAVAKQTPYFRDALNQILAHGERVF